jgi:hypothetical protein
MYARPVGLVNFQAVVLLSDWSMELTIKDEILPPKIDVYVDGNQVASQVGKPGRINTMLVDISNGKSLSLEISCSTAKNCNRRPYHFFKFQIEPGASSPGSR